MLTIKNLSKQYSDRFALSDVNFSIGNGLYALLGANGAGKTTLFKILTGYISQYSGTVDFGISNNQVIGYLPQKFQGYGEMKVMEFLIYIGRMKRRVTKELLKSDIERQLSIFGLCDLKDKKLKKLSGGQLRRVGLAQAFMLDPDLILLDEPTAGLDPKERIHFKNYLVENAQRRMVLISTHIVSDVSAITTKTFILKNGKIVMEGTEDELSNLCQGKVYEIEIDNPRDLQNMEMKYSVSKIYETPKGKIVRFIAENNPPLGASSVVADLNDVYLLNFKDGGENNEI